MENPIQDQHLQGAERPVQERRVSIKVVGVGGAGANAVDRLREENLGGVALAALNTDSQALASQPLAEKLLVGWKVTRGLGAGGDSELGRLAAESSREAIEQLVAGNDLILLVAGMGGGTGGGASPVVAEIAAQAGAMVIAFAAMPFSFEGTRRGKQAAEGLEALRKVCDAVIPLPNDLLLQVEEDGDSVLRAFQQGNSWVARGVRSIWSLLHNTGLINLDFASLRQVFAHRGGRTLFGFGTGGGDDPVTSAITDLKMCPLRHTPEFSRRADRLLVNITGGPDLTLSQVNEIMAAITEDFGRDPQIALGAVVDEDLHGQIEISVIGVTDPAVRAPKHAPGRSSTPPVRGRTVLGQPPAAARPPASAPPAGAAGTGPGSPAVPAAVSEPAEPEGQEEFRFKDVETRGVFEKTPDNTYGGVDLDVPTYLRRGIKVTP